MMYCGEPTVTDRPPLITFSPPSDGWAQAKAGKAGRTTVGGRSRITVAAFKRITTESAAKTLSRLTADETVKFHKFRSKIHANPMTSGVGPGCRDRLLFARGTPSFVHQARTNPLG